MLSNVLMTASHTARSSFPTERQRSFRKVPKVSPFLWQRSFTWPIKSTAVSLIFFLLVSGKRSGSASISSMVICRFRFGGLWIFGKREEHGEIGGVFVGEYCKNDWPDLNWPLGGHDRPPCKTRACVAISRISPNSKWLNLSSVFTSSCKITSIQLMIGL